LKEKLKINQEKADEDGKGEEEFDPDTKNEKHSVLSKKDNTQKNSSSESASEFKSESSSNSSSSSKEDVFEDDG
jgi:hypothetical protein